MIYCETSAFILLRIMKKNERRSFLGEQPLPTPSEWIAYGEVQGLIVLEAVDVVESALACVVRHVKTDTPIQAQHQEFEVVTETDARAHCQLAIEAAEAEIARLHRLCKALLIDVVVPHIASIEKQGGVETAKQATAVFKVEPQLDVTVLEHVGHLAVAGVQHKPARTHPTQGEGTQVVGTAHIELLGKGGIVAVAVREQHAGIDVRQQLAA